MIRLYLLHLAAVQGLHDARCFSQVRLAGVASCCCTLAARSVVATKVRAARARVDENGAAGIISSTITARPTRPVRCYNTYTAAAPCPHPARSQVTTQAQGGRPPPRQPTDPTYGAPLHRRRTRQPSLRPAERPFPPEPPLPAEIAVRSRGPPMWCGRCCHGQRRKSVNSRRRTTEPPRRWKWVQRGHFTHRSCANVDGSRPDVGGAECKPLREEVLSPRRLCRHGLRVT